MLGNSPSFFQVLLGTQKIGAIAGPISCWWQADEVQFLINDCNPKVLVVDPEFAKIVTEIRDHIPSVKQVVINAESPLNLSFPHTYLPEIIGRHTGEGIVSNGPSADDVAELMYTSGTTGKPKGVMITHRGLTTGARVKTGHISVGPADRILCVLPLFHSGGLNDLAFPCMYRASTIVLRRNFSASEFWHCVERYRINGFYIVPTMWNILLTAPEAAQVDTSSLHLGVSGAAPIPPEQLDECERRFLVPILEGYGSTENSGGITANSVDRRKYGSVGTAFEDVEVQIVNEREEALLSGEIGEIVVKGDTIMKGYFNNPEATEETIVNGWLHTGDLGYLDDEGFLFIVDRKKDMIIRGGVNIYPQELENAIATHPAVDGVAVIPEPHEIYGQIPKACIVIKRGHTADEDELRGFCRERMAEYKIPERIVFRESLPRSAVGKVIKKELLRILEEEKSEVAVPVGHLFESMKERFIPEKAGNVDATVSYKITGRGGGEWTVTVKDGTITVTEEIVESPRVYIVAKDRDYHDVATGKLDGITAVMTGKLSVEGDVGFMAQFRSLFRTM
jgi:long-chain acyl-CoA synthetase